ncbi:hypothetical protein LCGC14_2680310 [marine sediment metagenome]|uniref:Uncharacterized protein n=1 Tax=marine sediment metagenome TaxID=412755 RepID=A0A0F9CD93_9ZZZZ
MKTSTKREVTYGSLYHGEVQALLLVDSLRRDPGFSEKDFYERAWNQRIGYRLAEEIERHHELDYAIGCHGLRMKYYDRYALMVAQAVSAAIEAEREAA